MILLAIVDSNQQDAQSLEKCVEHYLKKRDIGHLIHRYDGGVEFIRSRTNYDIVLTDIQLEDMDGLDAARFLRIVNRDAALIFVTHRAEMVICGYEVNAMDFILKPIDQPVIDYALERALRGIPKYRESFFALKTPDSIVSLSNYSIYYVEVYGHELVYHTQRGDYRVRGQLGEAREKLKDGYFIQCSRSHLVNVRHMQGLYSDYLMVIGTNVPITKVHHKEIKQAYLDYLGKCV